ncbi:hypothetical protein FRB95_011508 [Tulasnella sp. JGI-2019a]|nr:hypothetical protein FRB95_011508 [Tulasnella sp. JGI-2019a]
MPPSIPDKIPCTTVSEFTSQFRDVQTPLNLPETEDNWEKISRALLQLASLVRGGAHKLDPEFLNAIKANYKPITTSMLTERTRLSASALELVSAMAPRLGARFEALVAILIPSLLKVLTRPNKVFVSRAQACLNLIVEHCHLPSLIPHLREAAKDKSITLRLGVTEATLQLVNTWDRGLLDVREGASTLTARHKGNVEDIETIIKETARDANPGVRQISRQVFDKYAEVWPERLDAFTAPLTPTIRRYLNVGKAKAPIPAAPLAKTKPSRPPSPKEKPKPEEARRPAPARPLRPVRPATAQATNPPVPGTSRSDASSSSGSPSRPHSSLGMQGPSQPASSSSSTAGWPPLPPSRPQTRMEINNDIDALLNAETRNATYRPMSRKPANVGLSSSAANSGPLATGPPSRPPSRTQHERNLPELYLVQRPSSRAQQHRGLATQPHYQPIQRPESRSYHPADEELYPMSNPPATSSTSSSHNRPRAVNGPVIRPTPTNVAPVPTSATATDFFHAQRVNTEMAPPPSHTATSRPFRPPLNPNRTASMQDPPVRPARPILRPGDPKPTFSGKLGFNVPTPLPIPAAIPPATATSAPQSTESSGAVKDQAEQGGKKDVDQVKLATKVLEQVTAVAASSPVSVPALPAPQVPGTSTADVQTPVNSRPASVMSTVTTASSTAPATAKITSAPKKPVTHKTTNAPGMLPNARVATTTVVKVAPSTELPVPPPATSASTHIDQQTPVNPRLVTAVLVAAAAGSGSNSGTKRPAVLQKRGAAAAQAGQVGGFAPTRRRPGVAEPTLSQLAKQKPTKTFVPAVKKPDLPLPPPAPLAAAPKKVANAVEKKVVVPNKDVPKAGRPARKVGGGTSKVVSAVGRTKVALAPPPIPKEVLIAAQVPLPPMTPDEVPLPPVEPDEVPLPPLKADEADNMGTPTQPAKKEYELVSAEVEDEAGDRTMKSASSAQPPPTIQSGEPLLDLDMTIVMHNTPSAGLRPQSSPTRDNLLDFDMSVVLPNDLFAPMAAVAPIPVMVLRDQPDGQSPLPLAQTPMRHHYVAKPKGKDIKGGGDVFVERVALSEREMNIMT